MHLRAVGVDPGTLTGVAIVTYDDGRWSLDYAKKIRVSTPSPLVDPEYIRKIDEILLIADADRLAIEDQYLNMGIISQSIKAHRTVTTNIGSIMRVIQIRSWWESLAAKRGYTDIRIFKPSMWRSLVFGRTKKLTSKEWKHKAQAFVKMLFGKKLSQDQAEAVLIAVAGLSDRLGEDILLMEI